jgi:hypothetical protein
MYALESPTWAIYTHEPKIKAAVRVAPIPLKELSDWAQDQIWSLACSVARFSLSLGESTDLVLFINSVQTVCTAIAEATSPAAAPPKPSETTIKLP